ncbi:hypothetical protein SUNI508_00847 [Seiridium unicorne]|uniref:Uncharacterized protein n=1 Tax=Seiridium unicorne TaxID=138068 RepID=A0ABR2V240_9PEZI
MQFFAALLATLVLSRKASADFWITHGTAQWQELGLWEEWDGAQFLPVKCNCHQVSSLGGSEWNEDVSGDNQGVRLKGSTYDPEVIGFNNKLGHYTIYKDRGYDMVDLRDNKVETCFLNTTRLYDCRRQEIGYFGTSMVFCSSYVQA